MVEERYETLLELYGRPKAADSRLRPRYHILDRSAWNRAAFPTISR